MIDQMFSDREIIDILEKMGYRIVKNKESDYYSRIGDEDGLVDVLDAYRGTFNVTGNNTYLSQTFGTGRLRDLFNNEVKTIVKVLLTTKQFVDIIDNY